MSRRFDRRDALCGPRSCRGAQRFAHRFAAVRKKLSQVNLSPGIAPPRKRYRSPNEYPEHEHISWFATRPLPDHRVNRQRRDGRGLPRQGDPAPIAEEVDSFAGANYGLFSVCDTGTLVYRTGAAARFALTWVDERGNSAGTLSDLGEYANATVSPDSTRVAVAVGQPGLRDIWILDVARGTSTRLTFDPANDDFPVWSPSGADIVFSSTRRGPPRMYRKPSDGSGEERLLTDHWGAPTSWSKDGRFLLFTHQTATTANDIWVLPDPGGTSGEAKPFSILATRFAEFEAQFSPDGQWIAYMCNESGMPEIYVRRFSPDEKATDTGAKWLISKGNGGFPRWRADGRQLFYSSLALQLMAVDIDTSKGFQAGTPRRLFATPPPFLNVGWDVALDGKRFLFSAAPSGQRATPFTVVLNWRAGLKQ
jgi:eukaryotic-like serine/threonine-protein kinase